ncbi:unnamed protein product [Symbiodinium sp. CCMP2592]|nr:unnamed protein product [Symbiodinium sp. CCMP2592]
MVFPAHFQEVVVPGVQNCGRQAILPGPRSLRGGCFHRLPRHTTWCHVYAGRQGQSGNAEPTSREAPLK